MGFLRKSRSPQEMGSRLAQLYEVAFSADRFHGLVDDQALANGQTMDRALGEWHAFGAFVFTRCLWSAFNDAERISPLIDSFRSAMVCRLGLSDRVAEFLVASAGLREKEYMEHFDKVKDGPGLSTFFSRVAAHITGHFSADLDKKALPQEADLLIVFPLTDYGMSVMADTTRVLKGGILEK